jgi:hypothetical protein
MVYKSNRTRTNRKSQTRVGTFYQKVIELRIYEMTQAIHAFRIGKPRFSMALSMIIQITKIMNME